MLLPIQASRRTYIVSRFRSDPLTKCELLQLAAVSATTVPANDISKLFVFRTTEMRLVVMPPHTTTKKKRTSGPASEEPYSESAEVHREFF